MLKLYENSVGQEYNDFYFKINEEEDNELVKNFYLVFHERITHFKKSKE